MNDKDRGLPMLMAAQVAREIACARIILELQAGTPPHDGLYLCEVEISDNGLTWRVERWQGAWITLGGYAEVVQWCALPQTSPPAPRTAAPG